MSIEAKRPSKERIERDGYLVYAEGDEIPETDVAELERQGYLSAKKVSTPAAPAKTPASKPTRKRTPRKS